MMVESPNDFNLKCRSFYNFPLYNDTLETKTKIFITWYPTETYTKILKLFNETEKNKDVYILSL
jgi:hypothetical protein